MSEQEGALANTPKEASVLPTTYGIALMEQPVGRVSSVQVVSVGYDLDNPEEVLEVGFKLRDDGGVVLSKGKYYGRAGLPVAIQEKFTDLLTELAKEIQCCLFNPPEPVSSETEVKNLTPKSI